MESDSSDVSPCAFSDLSNSQGRSVLVSNANVFIDDGHNDIEEINNDDTALVLTQPMPDHVDAATRSLYTYCMSDSIPIFLIHPIHPSSLQSLSMGESPKICADIWVIVP